MGKQNDTTGWDAKQVRSQSESYRQERQHPRRRGTRAANVVLYLLVVVLSSAILAGVGWLLANDLCSFNKDPVTTTIEVTADDTLGSVANKLKDEGLIQYKWFFKLFAKVAGAEDSIGIGSYELNSDMDYRALIVSMKNGSGSLNTDTVRVTIPEGYTVRQIIQLLADNGVNTVDALTDAAQNYAFDYDFINNQNLGDISRLEGYLFPDTYDFYLNENPANALGRLIKNFNTKFDEQMRKQLEDSGYTMQQIVIIASLIEKETDGTDQGKIASVIYNRLSDSGSHGTYRMLNIDASLLYGLPDHTGALTKEDLKADTPYNLYKYQGLPPTAIANPGLTALEAAVNPESTDYYYYALGKDGKHHFFATLNEHQAFTSSDQYGG
ncbi:endolytic transglycosylase MltG [Oscillibacter hominis]|uniref:Endolytic murein transglycosylase n=1 Tax=Oscillibacter hominis TaxID=2763056 RepID=A0A7G9B7W3_9FIRM|nr:endolytic transglycosylase MltG [Oscillibacter hominis]QNL45644.1 endolytic transglycosylase MltG [Oscillibacter hominis]